VNVLEVLGICEGALSLFMVWTWMWVLRQQGVYVGWRRTASLLGLALPTSALIVELALAVVLIHYKSLEGLDAASRGGGWSAWGARFWTWSFLATGVLSLSGLILAIMGKGSPRAVAAVWSSIMLGTFFVKLILAVNSFH